MRLSKTTLLLMLAAVAWVTWFAAAIESNQLFVPADYQRCVTINPGPLKPQQWPLHGSGPISEIA